MDKLFNGNLHVYKKDISYWNQIVKPKISAGEKPCIFYTATYLTPNYYSLLEFNELVRFAKKGFRIIIVLLDLNSLAHKQAKVLLQDFKTEEELLEAKVEEVKKIAISLGIPKEDLIVNRSSKIWKRLVAFSKPPIFFQLYSLLMEFNAQELNNPRRISHLIQMPMDMFIARYYHILYPEHISKPIDAMLVRSTREHAYLKTRTKMFEKGLINIEKPIFIVLNYMPYLIYDDLIPEWNMPIDEIKYVVSNLNPSKDELAFLLEWLRNGQGEKFKIAEGQKITKTSIAGIKKRAGSLQQADLNATISLNLYSYLQWMREKMKDCDTKSNILEVYTKEQTAEIGSILKSSIHLQILELADGNSTITQIAKRLDKQIANVSKYITQLKQAGLVEQTAKGTIIRSVNNITFNLDEGFQK